MRATPLLLLLPAPIVKSSGLHCEGVTCDDESNYWRITGDCELSQAFGRCVTDGPGDYGNSERCTAYAVDDFYIYTALFDLEATHDWVNVGGTEYTSNAGGRGPNGVHMTPGERLEWYSDSSITDRGWKICAEYADWEGGSSFTSFFRNFDFPFWIVPFPFLIFAILIHMRQRRRRMTAMAHRQQAHAAAVRPPPRPVAQAIATPAVPSVAGTAAEVNLADELGKLAELHHAGHLNDEQYEAAKARLLGIPAVHGSVQTAVPVGAVQAVHAIPMPAGFAGGQGVVMATAVPMQAV